MQYWDTYREMIRWRVLLHFQLYNTYTFPHQCYLVKLKMIYKVNRSVDKDKLSTRLVFTYNALQWRHNEHDGASNHQLHDCLLHRLIKWRSKKTSNSASLAFVRGIHRWPVNYPHKKPVTRKMFQFDEVIMGYTLMTRRLLKCRISIWNSSSSHTQILMFCKTIW